MNLLLAVSEPSSEVLSSVKSLGLGKERMGNLANLRAGYSAWEKYQRGHRHGGQGDGSTVPHAPVSRLWRCSQAVPTGLCSSSACGVGHKRRKVDTGG